MEKKPKQTREAARIASLTKQVERLKQELEGYRQLVQSMDAVLLEIAKKYGECPTAGTEAPVWYLTFPIPDVFKMRKGQVMTAKENGEYKVLAMSEEAMDAAAKLAGEKAEE